MTKKKEAPKETPEVEGYVEPDDGMDDLLSDAGLPAEEITPDGDAESDTQPQGEEPEDPQADTTAEEPEGEEAKPEPEGEEHQPSDEEGEKEEEPESEVTFKYKGKKYTLADLQENPELRAKVFTSAEQQTYFQKRHEETQQKLKEYEAKLARIEQIEQQRQQQEYERQQRAQQEKQQQEQPKLTPQQMMAHYESEVEQLVKDGWIDEDAKDLYPKAITGIVSLRDEMFTRLAQLESVVGSVLNETQTRAVRETHQTVEGQFRSILGGIADEGGIFEPLKSIDNQDKFLNYVTEKLNPPVQALLSDPSVLRDIYIGLHHEKLVEMAAADHKKKLSGKKNEDNRRFATGEGGGVKPGTQATPEPTEDEMSAKETWMDL